VKEGKARNSNGPAVQRKVQCARRVDSAVDSPCIEEENNSIGENTIIEETNGGSCIYDCSPKVLSAYCTVEFDPLGQYSGRTKGLCFSINKQCLGTPKSCKKCKDVCKTSGNAPKTYTKVAEIECLRRSDSSKDAPCLNRIAFDNGNGPTTDVDGGKCTYNCKPKNSAFCKVRFTPDSEFNGPSTGLCFNTGQCFGTPSKCQDCTEICTFEEGEKSCCKKQ